MLISQEMTTRTRICNKSVIMYKWIIFVLSLSSGTICYSYNLTRGSCPEGSLTCQMGFNWRAASSSKCIKDKHLCDNETDCSDGSDEKYCKDNYNYGQDGYTYRFVQGSCPDNQVMCPKYIKCIHYHWICDGSTACSELSEDTFCPYDRASGFHFKFNSNDCPEGFVKCRSGSPRNTPKSITNKNCIKKTWICDGTKDCTDNSDETFCPYILSFPQEATIMSTKEQEIEHTTMLPFVQGYKSDLTKIPTSDNQEHGKHETLFLVVIFICVLNTIFIVVIATTFYFYRRRQANVQHRLQFLNLSSPGNM